MKAKPSKQQLRSRKRKVGQTLIETLIAVSLLSAGIAGTSRIIIMAMQLSSMAKDEHVCLQLAINRMERIDKADFGDVMMWTASNEVVNSQGNADPLGNYMLTTKATFPEQSNTNYVEIVINVYKRDHVTLMFDTPPKQFSTFTTDLK